MFGCIAGRTDAPLSSSKESQPRGAKSFDLLIFSPSLLTKVSRYVDYAMHRVRLLKHHSITPYIVFDGGPLPAKKETESLRLASRIENREKGLRLTREGRHAEARECFVKAVDVTPEMAFQLIKVRLTSTAPHESSCL
jgi:5'-3' exonuclease